MRTQAAATRRDRSQPVFHGRHVVRAAFVLAMCGWGIGFYGPPIYLHAVIARTGWPLAWVSAAVTVHFVFGALVVARLPRWHARFGVGPCAVAGAVASTLGVLGWAQCSQPWQLLVAALASGGGWVAMGAVAINAAIAPWFVHARPAALATAYNGASIGGVLFSPLWVALIGAWGFGPAALVIGLTTIVVTGGLSRRVFAQTPQSLGQRPDGDDTPPAATAAAPAAAALPGRLLWRDRCFRTL
ncbi:MAG TPA: MFS transporter, partial [Burkholderiaceae bacterium]|nr:MFS transporter [Burkholderiaceae bacterium]